MCPKGSDPIEKAQVVDWAVQGIYFRTYTIAEEFTTDFDNVVEFLEDKPQEVFYTVTFTDEYGDEWTTSVQSVDYFTECQTYDGGSNNMANCISTPDVSINSDVHGYLLDHATSLNSTLAALPNKVFEGGFVWGAAGDLAYKDSADAACDLADTGSACGAGASVEQTSVVTFPIAGDDDYDDSLDFRLDMNIITGCEWDRDLDFDGAHTDKFGLCLFVKMPAPGVREALKVNYWYKAQGNIDEQSYLFSEVTGETYGFTDDDSLHDPPSLVVVQNLQDKRVWNSADGDLEFSFIDEWTSNLDYCAKRGICDFESGVCNCFSGFSGLRCESQNAVTYSF